MKFVLSSTRRECGGLVEFFQPRAIESADDPGLTWRKQDAKMFDSQEEAALAIPAFLDVKREQRKRISKLFGWPDANPPVVLDPIIIEVVEH
jgi:hypothetical protein